MENDYCYECEYDIILNNDLSYKCGHCGYEGKKKKIGLNIDLDSLFGQGYYHGPYDFGGRGHNILIKEEDKERFIQDYLKNFEENIISCMEIEYEEEN